MAVADAAAAEAATLMTAARSVVLTSLAQYLLLSVFFRILFASSQSGDHSQENIAKSGYRK
jgi:hypothetical protein